ncbi:MAG: threonine--tRNA ligase [Nitrospirota bacterium]
MAKRRQSRRFFGDGSIPRFLGGSMVVAARLNGRLVDLTTEINKDAEIELITIDSQEGRDIYRHSTSHVMAHAVKELYPDAKLAIGPAIPDGFYYDFDYDRSFTPEDIEKIEKKMDEIIRADRPFKRKILSKEEALRLFAELGEPYKLELINELGDSDDISAYEEGDFTDLCAGPHLPSAGMIKAFKLLGVAGAYWKGDEKNKMLQRIYGTSFETAEGLDKYLKRLEEIKLRDHRRLGRELDLFSINEDVGAGLVLWHPRGAIIRRIIEDFWVEGHSRAGYEIVYTPHIARLELWKESGHWEFYRDNMYSPIDVDGIYYETKPMNCPFHIMIYKSTLRSYRDLPVKYAELGTVYRYERSGVLHGLLRVRGFTQDDAHIFCRPDQLRGEILDILDLTLYLLRTFGFKEYDIYLSTMPEKFVGSPENWEKATEALRTALETKGLAYQTDPGEGVFYGPKIDIKVKDVIGRAWQCSTIQVDFNLPERFSITYRGDDGLGHQPIMIHRALMGSLERFLGILIEHYKGAFPLWLSPVQVKVLTVTDRSTAYATQIAERLKEEGVRTEVDSRNEKVGFKIREASLQKVPYMFIIGDHEVETETVSVRVRGRIDLGIMTLSEIKERIKQEITEKRHE